MELLTALLFGLLNLLFFKLLLILYEFHIMHPDPTYFPIPLNLPSAPESPQQKKI